MFSRFLSCNVLEGTLGGGASPTGIFRHPPISSDPLCARVDPDRFKLSVTHGHASRLFDASFCMLVFEPPLLFILVFKPPEVSKAIFSGLFPGFSLGRLLSSGFFPGFSRLSPQSLPSPEPRAPSHGGPRQGLGYQLQLAGETSSRALAAEARGIRFGIRPKHVAAGGGGTGTSDLAPSTRREER